MQCLGYVDIESLITDFKNEEGTGQAARLEDYVGPFQQNCSIS